MLNKYGLLPINSAPLHTQK